MDFRETSPPIFAKAEEPLEADEWIRVVEQKFGLILCTEVQKPLFATQQLCGPASTWWESFIAVQPQDRQVTWEEFTQAFRELHILDDILQIKLEEFLRLRQGAYLIMQYIRKFNHISQYAIEHVNRDVKKSDCFMRDLNSKI